MFSPLLLLLMQPTGPNWGRDSTFSFLALMPSGSSMARVQLPTTRFFAFQIQCPRPRVPHQTTSLFVDVIVRSFFLSPIMAPSHTDDSSDEEPDAPPAKPRRSRDDLSANEVLPSRTRDAANRQPSRKQASQGKLRAPYKTLLTAIPTDKENMESAEQQLAKLQKQVARMKKQAKQREKAAKGAAPLDDDELESEERSDNEGVVSFASAITPLWRLPPPPPRPTTILRKTKQGDKPAAAKISARAFLRLAESTEQDRNLDEEEPRPENDPSKDLDIGMDVDSDDQRSRARSLERRPSVSADQAHSCHRSGSRSGRRSSPVRPASPHSHSDGRTPRGRSPALDVTSHKRSRPTPNSPPRLQSVLRP
ncbi:hypothetical protein B0H10DRAFT_603776, partial [Mycena sp. CBHHK59/15]